jgi:hypothetical protein
MKLSGKFTEGITDELIKIILFNSPSVKMQYKTQRDIGSSFFLSFLQSNALSLSLSILTLSLSQSSLVSGLLKYN